MRWLFTIFAVACCTSLPVLRAGAADCSLMQEIRLDADKRFQNVRGPATRDPDSATSMLKAEGAKCMIRDPNSRTPVHECTWIVTQDQKEALSLFEIMASEVAAC